MSIKRHVTSLQHPFVKHLVKLRLDRAYREEQQVLVIEGSKPVRELSSCLRKLIYTESQGSCGLSAPEDWIVTEAVMKKISGLSSPEGILAEVSMPSYVSLKNLKYILVLDGINDPGNLGTLLRTALALGWEGVYLLPNTCDLYNEKALRAARGAHFKLSLARGTSGGLKKLIQENDLKPFVADLHGQSLKQIFTHKGILLVLGNEAHGASKEINSLCSKITIPMLGDMESLNVAIAGSILMYLLRNQGAK